MVPTRLFPHSQIANQKNNTNGDKPCTGTVEVIVAPINSAPDEIIIKILSHLPLKDLLRSAYPVSKQFSKCTAKIILSMLNNPVHNQALWASLEKPTMPKFLASLKKIPWILFDNLPLKTATDSYVLHQTSALIFKELKKKNPIPLNQANALLLDGTTPLELLKDQNRRHITHLELNQNWLVLKQTWSWSPHTKLINFTNALTGLQSISSCDTAYASEFSTILHVIVGMGLTRLVPLAITADNLNAKDWRDDTPLHRAAEVGNIDAARLLISAGANIIAKNLNGDTPFHVADYRNHPEVARLLKDATLPSDRKIYDSKCTIA